MAYTDWAIRYGEVTYPFGEVKVVGYTIGGRDYRTDDSDRPRADGRFLGIDFANPGDIEIELIIRARGATRQEKFDNAMEIREAFTRIWNADAVRKTNGEVTDLIVGGRFAVEGRPRHIDWDDSITHFGTIRGSALFVRTTLESYPVDNEGGTGWQSATLQLVPAQVGGIKEMLSEPIKTMAGTSRAAPVFVDSIEPAYGIYELTGPIQSNAQIEVAGRWRLYLNQSLSPFQTARIDTRPGRAGTYLNNVPRQLLKPESSLLADCSLLPGDNVVALRGTSIEGTASVRIMWRSTRGGI